jgi:hypothetical protein
VERADGRKITARVVKSAVQELCFGGGAKPASRETRPTKAEKRKLINETIGQILVLLSQKASHEALAQKVETLHGHIQALFAKSN